MNKGFSPLGIRASCEHAWLVFARAIYLVIKIKHVNFSWPQHFVPLPLPHPLQ